MKLEDYRVGWICALPCELAAARCMLDDFHERVPQPALDDNIYTLGSIGPHNIAIACLPSGVMGTVSATRVAERMRATFPSLHFVLMVGIGGGVPSSAHDIRLGDVVVSEPGESHGGVIQYDFGKTVQEGHFVRNGHLNKPPDVLLKAVSNLQAQHKCQHSEIGNYLSECVERYPLRRQACTYVGETLDQLFEYTYNHPKDESTCVKCDPSQVSARPQRDIPGALVVHYGLIASGNQVMRDGILREQLRQQLNVLCFEMEAAGLMDTFPCVVIRGICDYADSHKNKIWQDYAASVAAAYAKELLNLIPFQEITSENAVTEGVTGREIDNLFPTRRQLLVTPKYFQGLGLNLGLAPEIDHTLFIGRSAELEEMQKLLLTDRHIASRHVLILGGIGGVGKTQLAIAFAKKSSILFTSVFWINATTETSLKSCFTQLANRIRSLDDSGRMEGTHDHGLVSNWLSQPGNDQWLLIFDNYDDPDQYDIREFYPMASHGSIIITTRRPESIQGQKLRVGPMTQEFLGLKILETRSGRKGLTQDIGARQLVQRLDGLPLALATAGAFLKQHPTSFSEYLERYKTTWRILSRPIKGLPEYQGRTLYTTWDMSFRKVREQYQEAAELLKFLGYLDHQQIWYELFLAGRDIDSPAWFLKVTADKFAFGEAMEILVDLCLVEVHHETDTYSMHVCVHDWVIEELNTAVDETQYALAFDCVARTIDEQFLSQSYVSMHHGRFIPHAIWLADSRFRGLMTNANGINQRSRQSNVMAWSFMIRGLNKPAEQVLTALLEAQATSFGFSNSNTIETAFNLAIHYEIQGKYAESQELMTKTVSGIEEASKAYYEVIRDAHAMLGFLSLNQGMFLEAEEAYSKSLHSRKESPVLDDHKILPSISGLAEAYAAQGKDPEAKVMFRRALDGYLRILTKVPHDNQTTWYLARYFKTTSGLVKLSSTTSSQPEPLIADALFLLRRHMSIYSGEISSVVFHTLFYWLGRCFMAVGDDTNAQKMFEQEFGLLEDRSDGFQVILSLRCDGCSRAINADIGLNICRRCPGVDLCESCFGQYISSGGRVGGCIYHPFFRVETKNARWFSSDELNDWIQQAAQAYGQTSQSLFAT